MQLISTVGEGIASMLSFNKLCSPQETQQLHLGFPSPIRYIDDPAISQPSASECPQQQILQLQNEIKRKHQLLTMLQNKLQTAERDDLTIRHEAKPVVCINSTKASLVDIFRAQNQRILELEQQLSLSRGNQHVEVKRLRQQLVIEQNTNNDLRGQLSILKSCQAPVN